MRVISIRSGRNIRSKNACRSWGSYFSAQHSAPNHGARTPKRRPIKTRMDLLVRAQDLSYMIWPVRKLRNVPDSHTIVNYSVIIGDPSFSLRLHQPALSTSTVRQYARSRASTGFGNLKDAQHCTHTSRRKTRTYSESVLATSQDRYTARRYQRVHPNPELGKRRYRLGSTSDLQFDR